ncbi:MAG: DUF2975 domain-containing protein [Verrucomicrobiales bacterium]
MNPETSHSNDGLPASGSPRAGRIRKMSRLLQLGCRLLLGLLLLAAVGVSVPPIQALLAGTPREAYFPAALLMHLYWGVVLWLLERMFHVFARQDGVFDRRCARYLKWLGGLFLAGPGIQLLFLIAGATIGDTGYSVLLVTLPAIMGRALLGACVLMLGWVVEEGCALHEEQALTV